jgi:hypothetical protein
MEAKAGTLWNMGNAYQEPINYETAVPTTDRCVRLIIVDPNPFPFL